MTDEPFESMPASKPMTRQDLEVSMIAKAWRDPAFNAALLRDPKVALQAQLAGIDPAIRLPESLDVQVHSETADNYHLVIPRNPVDVGQADANKENLGAVAPQTIAVLTGVNSGPGVVTVVVGIQTWDQVMAVMSSMTVVAGVNVVVLAGSN
jgi:hypothetical protein